MPIVDDPDDGEQLRAALLDRDRRLVKLRSELVAMERWVQQLQAQVDELGETTDNARSALEHLLGSVPDLLEPEVDDLAVAVADDQRGS
jgi:chromosome segregation ATPase